SDYIKAEDWQETVRLLQTILDAREDTFIRPGMADGRWISVRAEAERVLVSLPAAGQEGDEVSFNPLARKMFIDASKQHDIAALNDLVRRYAHTSSGADALILLGTLHLDRGRFDLAAACFERLLRLPVDKHAPETLFKAALAYRGIGDVEREDRA